MPNALTDWSWKGDVSLGMRYGCGENKWRAYYIPFGVLNLRGRKIADILMAWSGPALPNKLVINVP